MNSLVLALPSSRARVLTSSVVGLVGMGAPIVEIEPVAAAASPSAPATAPTQETPSAPPVQAAVAAPQPAAAENIFQALFGGMQRRAPGQPPQAPPFADLFGDARAQQLLARLARDAGLPAQPPLVGQSPLQQ